MKGKVAKIETMGLVDGPGIRTVVFLQGCPLRCIYCHNPEMQEFNGKTESYTPKQIVNILKRYKTYYKNNGGVTFSGGEPILQIEDLEPFFISLNKKNINVCFETALFVPENLLKIAIKYANEFIVDIKILDSKKCKNILGGNIISIFN